MNCCCYNKPVVGVCMDLLTYREDGKSLHLFQVVRPDRHHVNRVTFQPVHYLPYAPLQRHFSKALERCYLEQADLRHAERILKVSYAFADFLVQPCVVVQVSYQCLCVQHISSHISVLNGSGTSSLKPKPGIYPRHLFLPFLLFFSSAAFLSLSTLGLPPFVSFVMMLSYIYGANIQFFFSIFSITCRARRAPCRNCVKNRHFQPL